ncbi:MAG: tetratricopeptide repeat protein, partial [Anaerolineae bacterium]
WAFTGALGPNEAPTNALLRQLVATQAKGVNMERLQRSLTYYRQATSLSPNNAGLWNELAATQFILGDTEAALASLRHSEEIDPIFVQTHIYRGDMLATLGDRTAALAAYRRAAELAGDDQGVLSAVGVYSAQTGDIAAALDAFQRLAQIQLAGLNSTQQQLADLDALVSRLGGYSALLPGAGQRRDALQNSITAQRSQLHLTYRNLALVLRDAGRTAEALEAARTALAYASDAERPTIEALIAELQRKTGG